MNAVLQEPQQQQQQQQNNPHNGIISTQRILLEGYKEVFRRDLELGKHVYDTSQMPIQLKLCRRIWATL